MDRFPVPCRSFRFLPSTLLIVTLCAAGPAAGTTDVAVPSAGPRWVALGEVAEPAPVSWHPIGERGEQVRLRTTVDGILVDHVRTPVGLRGRIDLPGSGVTAETGLPLLPVLRALVELPPGAELRIGVTDLQVTTRTLAELGLEASLLPVQPPVPKIEGAERWAPFVEDAATYSADRFYPERRAVVADRAVLRGRHVALIELRLVRYNPKRESVEIVTHAELSLDPVGGSPEARRRAAGRLSSPMSDAWVARSIVSARPAEADAATRSGGASSGAEGLVVVAHDDLVDAITPFLDWKRKSGFRVELIPLSDLGPSPTDADVKAALQARYDGWSDPPLGFVLMVGDTDFTPIHWGNGGGNSQVTDNWYACLDGTDYLPDVAIARISTRDATETANVVDKLLTYERATFATEDWIKRVGFIGTLDSGYITMIEGTHDDCIDAHYTPNGYQATDWSHGYASCDRHYNSHEATTADIAGSINEGRALVNYSGHGGTYSWQGPTSYGQYGQSEIRSNTNDGRYPFVISNACVTGTLDATECFGETWQKEPGRGAIGFWGASNNSYWGEDDVLQRSIHGNLFPLDATPPLGIAVNETKLDLYTHYGATGSVAYYFDMYNLLSEPTLVLWTRPPRALDVAHPAALPVGESSLAVTVSHAGQPLAGALVAVRTTDEAVFEAGYTDTAGGLSLTLDPAPQAVGTLELTVTGHDLRPFESTLEIIAPDTPWLLYRTHSVDDAAGGDGDGAANPGEDLILSVALENVGQLPGTGIDATLTTSTPQWCQVLDAAATFPDLAPGAQAISEPDHFTVRIDPAAPDGVQLGFDLDWSAEGGHSGTTALSETLRQVDFALADWFVDDAAAGNGNGVAGPGETVDLALRLSNQGHRDAGGLSAVLSSNSEQVTILDGAAVFPDLGAGQTGESIDPAYRIQVSSDAPDQVPIAFELAVTDGASGYVEQLGFELPISSCATVDSTADPLPVPDNGSAIATIDYLAAIEVTEVNVGVEISHPYRGDLRLLLQSPSGSQVLLHDRGGGSADDLVTWYDAETAPVESLDILQSENAFGRWSLIVEDLATGNSGTIDGWSLEVCGPGLPPHTELAVAGFELSDTGACNADGVADVGETVYYDVAVANIAWTEASGIEVSLSSDAAVAVRNNPVVIPDLRVGESAIARFEVAIGAVGCLEQASFVVSMQAAQGSWTGGFVDRLEGDNVDTLDAEDCEQDGAEPAGWTHASQIGADGWQIAGDRNHSPGGAWSWFVPDSLHRTDGSLVSPQFVLPPTVRQATLEFWHWFATDPGYDGGVLELSTDGANWIDLGPWMTHGGYGGTLGGSNPIAGRPAWTGSTTTWSSVVVDVAAWAGETIRLRWRMTSDFLAGGAGWWIDDIQLQTHDEPCDAHACGVPGEVRLATVSKDGSDVVLGWQDDPLCLEFRVWRAVGASSGAGFVDVTFEDGDPTDLQFRDTDGGPLLFWLIEGVGPDGHGPWGHYGQ